MNNIQKLLTVQSVKYKNEASSSVKKNTHMNDLTGNEKISMADISVVVETIIQFVSTDNTLDDEVNKNDLCIKCVEIVKKINNLTPLITNKKIQDALLVDWANYVAFNQGIDLALYTEDLLKWNTSIDHPVPRLWSFFCYKRNLIIRNFFIHFFI